MLIYICFRLPLSDNDGGGKDVEMHHHCHWQVELLQLRHKVHPPQYDLGVPQGDGGGWGWAQNHLHCLQNFQRVVVLTVPDHNCTRRPISHLWTAHQR